jgi:hypothetical protein
MESRVARVLRGTVVGVFATLVAAGSHAAAGGAVPSALSIVVGLAFATLLGTLAAGRRPSTLRIAIIAGGAQFAFHAVFAALTPFAASVAPGHHPGHLTLDTAAHHPDDPAMWIAHAVAGIATVLFLRRAEAALWALLGDALERAAVPVAMRVEIPELRIVTYSPEPRRALALLIAAALSRRGPPVSFV